MTIRAAAILCAVSLLAGCTKTAPLDEIARSQVDANVPSQTEFRAVMLRGLRAGLEATYGTIAGLDYELLRQVPTQVGIGYPKFYVWLRFDRPGSVAVAGAARVAAIDREHFELTHFLSAVDIVRTPESAAQIFPAALLQKIGDRATEVEIHGAAAGVSAHGLRQE
jgi:hypothetical protein